MHVQDKIVFSKVVSQYKLGINESMTLAAIVEGQTFKTSKSLQSKLEMEGE